MPTALVTQITETLTSARCLQDLDNELSKITEPDWQVFVAAMRSDTEVVEKVEPERARFLRSLLHSYLERRQVVTAAGWLGGNQS